MPVATKILRAMLICVSLFQPRLAVVMIDQAKRIAVASQLPAAADPGIFDEAPCASRRSEEPTSELQSLMRISYAVLCLQDKMLCPIVLAVFCLAIRLAYLITLSHNCNALV